MYFLFVLAIHENICQKNTVTIIQNYDVEINAVGNNAFVTW
jgi:hypothetical protein